jgi:ABC-type antimicrobial peptide transport system permease subunit
VVPLNGNITNGMKVSTDLSTQPVHVLYRMNYVGPDYFRTMQIPLLRGREFSSADRKTGPYVVIVNENMAHNLFAKADPIGRHIRFDWGEAEVVGLARNSKYFTLGERNANAMYEPYDRRASAGDLNFLVRTSGPPDGLVPIINAVLGPLEPTAALETKPMSKALTFALLPSRFGAAILGSMGLLGLLLASIGLYGVLLYSVSRRTREIGVRMALGASPRGVLALVTRHSLGLVAAGLAIGMTLAVFAARPLATFLVPEINATGAGNFVVVGLVLCAVALLATLPPALRALRVDPVVALRHD